MSQRKWILTVSLSFALTACGPSISGPVPPGVDRAKYGAMQYTASIYLSCSQEKLTYEGFGTSRHLFKGCNDSIEMLYLEGGDDRAYGSQLGFILPSAANRYAKEMRCDIKTTSEERIDAQTHIVEGCGSRVTYVSRCDSTCSWVANAKLNGN